MRRGSPRTAACVACAAAALAIAAHAAAQTITVNAALDDVMDFGGAQQVGDLPGPDGLVTIREAVTAANNTPGPQTIAFAIPQSQWWFLFADRATIRLEMMLQLTDPGTTLDFASQTAFTGDTNPAGGEVALYYAGPPAAIPCLWLMTSDCTVRGLDAALGNNFGNGIWITGNGNRILGCTTTGLMIRGDYGGGDGNQIGGTAAGEGNLFTEGVDIIANADGNVLVGNRFRWGVRIEGDSFSGTCDGNRIGGPSVAERNSIAGRGSFSSEGTPTGVQVEVIAARDTVIENNFIGTTVDGMAKHPGHSGTGGVSVWTGAVNTVVRGNVISGFAMTGVNHAAGQRFGTAVGVGSTASGTVIVGNRVGVAADGVTPILNVDGIVVASDPVGVPGATRIGGPVRKGFDEANIVATGERGGVRVLFSAAGVEITRNSIHGNLGLGIDLASTVPMGVTPNDPLDADTGANGLQNFPVLATAESTSMSTRVSGTLASTPGAAFRIEFFASAARDASGHGEGERFLGSTEVVADAKGAAHFVALIAEGVPAGQSVTATATNLATRSTSEFSACVATTALRGCASDLTGDGLVGGADIAALLSNWGGAGTGDIDGDGVVDAQDIAALLSAWGACP